MMLLFPLFYYIYPEVYKMQGTGIFCPDQLYYVMVGAEVIQAFANIGAMQFSVRRVGEGIILLRNKNAFILCIINRLGKGRVIDIIHRAPGIIGIVSASFQNIMLKVIFMQQYQSFFIGQLRKPVQPFPIPGIVFGKIVFTQAIKGGVLSAARKRQFVKRSFYIAIHSTDTFMIVAAAIVPQTIVMIEGNNVTA